MDHDSITEISSEQLGHVTGGGVKGKIVKGAWKFAKWTGVPALIGGGAAWAKRQIMGPEKPAQPEK